MRWAGVTFRIGIPVRGRRVPSKWIEDESYYWNFDWDDVYDWID